MELESEEAEHDRLLFTVVPPPVLMGTVALTTKSQLEIKSAANKKTKLRTRRNRFNMKLNLRRPQAARLVGREIKSKGYCAKDGPPLSSCVIEGKKE